MHAIPRLWQLAHVVRPSHFSFRPEGNGKEKKGSRKGSGGGQIGVRDLAHALDRRTSAELACHGRPPRHLLLASCALVSALAVGLVAAHSLHDGRGIDVSFALC